MHETVTLETEVHRADPRVADCRARYLANLSALYRRDPPLAARVEALPFAALPALEPAQDGGLTLRLTADDGRPLYAHSRYRPADEARAFVDGLSLEDPRTIFVAGSGLGYHLAELDRRFDRPLLIVAEDDLHLLKLTLCCADLTGPIAEGRLIFLTSADRASVHERLGDRQTDIMLGTQVVVPPLARRYHARFHAEARTALTDFVTFGKLQLVTVLRNARITARNVAFNLPRYLAGPGVEVLAGRAAGYPAIVVAAGPSLARNVRLLPELRERAVIISVQTAFKMLLALDAPPHFVTSLDFHEISTQFFDGVADVRGAVLVAEPKATWHVLDRFPGRVHVLHNRFAEDLLREAAPPRGALKAGTTVAHLAFYLAEHLGCDPIILVGQDLAYSDGVYYPPGMPIERIWQPELSRFCTVETKQLERIVRARPILRTVRDVHGRAAHTDDQLFNYAQQFEADFAGCAATIIHACEGGMRLAGTRVMTLREAADRFCRRPLPAALLEPAPAPRDPAAGRRACAALRARLDELAALRGIAVEMSGLLERLETLLDRPAQFNRHVARVDELRTLIQKYDRTYRLVIDVSQAAELRRYTADRGFERAGRETAETARRRLRRDREFVASFLEGCAWLEGMLPEALRRIEESAP